MKIAIRRGHQRTGADGCASGIVNEIFVAEDYKNRVIAKFRALGHQVLDCTPPEANRSLANSLNYGIDKANNWGADIFISCHVNNAYNSYNGTIGCEVIHHRNSSKGKDYATRVERELANIGFRSRGAKSDIRGLAEINNTNMPCIIIEPFFVEATGDVAKYREVGVEGIADAIVKGVVGKTVTAFTTPAQKPTSKPLQQAWELNIQGDIVRRLQHELNRQFGVGLKEDGYAGDATMQKLILVRQGARGNITKIIQELLIRKGYSVSYGADGIFGQGTYNAVCAIQRANGLSIDGIVGQNTWEALLRA